MRDSNPRVPDRLIAIGGIHGHAKALRRLLEIIQPTPADTIVTLGDCVDRGPDSRGVLDCLIELQRKCHLVPILANHDDMMLESRNDHHAEGRWLAQGGEVTLLSYGERPELTKIQGNRALNICKTSEEPFKRGFVPAADLSFASETSFNRSVLLQNRERQATENGTNFWSRSFPNSTRILCKCYI